MPIAPGSAIAAPIVAGARGSELDPLTEAARNLGLRQTGCLSVGRDRFVVELDFPAAGSGQSAPPAPVTVATAVGALRSQGFAVVAGPTSEGHRVAWARRNNRALSPSVPACAFHGRGTTSSWWSRSTPDPASAPGVTRPPLIDLAPHLCRLTAPHGALGLSGLSPSQPSRVEAALSPMGVVRADERDEWVSLWFRW